MFSLTTPQQWNSVLLEMVERGISTLVSHRPWPFPFLLLFLLEGWWRDIRTRLYTTGRRVSVTGPQHRSEEDRWPSPWRLCRSLSRCLRWSGFSPPQTCQPSVPGPQFFAWEYSFDPLSWLKQNLRTWPCQSIASQWLTRNVLRSSPAWCSAFGWRHEQVLPPSMSPDACLGLYKSFNKLFYNFFIQVLTIFALLGSLFDRAELHGVNPSPRNRHFKRLRMQSTLFTWLYTWRERLRMQSTLTLCVCSRDCTCGVHMGVVSTLGVRGDWNVRLWRATGCGYDKERYPNEETTEQVPHKKQEHRRRERNGTGINGLKYAWNSQERHKAVTRTISELNQNTIYA